MNAKREFPPPIPQFPLPTEGRRCRICDLTATAFIVSETDPSLAVATAEAAVIMSFSQGFAIGLRAPMCPRHRAAVELAGKMLCDEEDCVAEVTTIASRLVGL